MVRDLSNADGAAIAAARGDQPYESVEEVQRRAGVGRGALDRIGDADGFGRVGASRRAGLWEVKGLGDAPLPLFAAADERNGRLRREAIEPIEAVRAALGDGPDVICDGGIRRGSDVVKALALGATACSIGRPYLYGLAAGGEAGVDRILTLLSDEFERTLTLAGVNDIALLTSRHVRNRSAEYRAPRSRT